MLWMAVTADQFELPLCVEESASILARKLHTTESTVRARKLRQNSGKMLIGEYDYAKTKRGTEMYFCKGLSCGRTKRR